MICAVNVLVCPRAVCMLRMAGLMLLVVTLLSALAVPAQAGELAPEQVVRNLQKAMDTADVALLDQCADVEQVLGQAVDIFLKDLQATDKQGSLPPVLAMMLSQLTSSESARVSIRGLLQREAAEFVRYGVRSGNFAGKPREAAPPSGMLAPFFADASLGRKEVRHIAPALRQGDVALVAFEVLDHGNGNTYPVQAELHRADGAWRIVGLPNLPALIDQIRAEAGK